MSPGWIDSLPAGGEARLDPNVRTAAELMATADQSAADQSAADQSAADQSAATGRQGSPAMAEARTAA